MSIYFPIILSKNFRLTFKIGDVFAARISETEGFAGQAKCGGAKCRRGRKPERRFA